MLLLSQKLYGYTITTYNKHLIIQELTIKIWKKEQQPRKKCEAYIHGIKSLEETEKFAESRGSW